MIYRTARILLEIVGIAIGGAIVVAALALWRLSSAPFEAKFIGPYIEQAVNNADLGFAVQVTEAKIDWRGFRPRLDLHFHGVSVSGENGATVGALQDGTLGISVRNLVFGKPSVIAIDLNRPEIHVVRDNLDRYALRLGPVRAGSGSEGGDFGSIIARATAPPNDRERMGELRRIRIVSGRVFVEDRKLGISWSAPDVDVEIARNADAATAKIDLTLALPEHTAKLSGEARFDGADGKTSFALNVTNFDAAAAAPLSAVLSPLAALAVPVSGQVHAVIDQSGALVSGEASMTGDKGQLVLPAMYPEPLPLSSVRLDLHFAEGSRRLVLDRLAVDVDSARINVVGSVTADGQRLRMDAQADLANVPLGKFDALWPHGFAVGGRDWVTAHIPDGTIRSGSVHVTASAPASDATAIDVGEIKGVFDYTGLEVHYFPPLPPVKGISGHATFDGRGMDLTIDSGTLGDIAVSGGTVALTGFDRDDRGIDIGLTLDGPLMTALSVLDSPPLGYAHDLGLSPAGVSGHFNARAKFAFPLIKALLFKQVGLGVQGRLDGVTAAGVVGERVFSGGDLTIALDKKSMTLDGKARLSDVPVALNWRESFNAADPVRSRIAFQAALSDSARTDLGLKLPDAVQLKGKVAIDGKVTIDRAKHTTLDAGIDLAGAELAIDKLGVRKPSGVAGRADLSAIFAGDTLQGLRGVHLGTKDVDVEGSADFLPNGGVRHGELLRIVTPRNDFALTVDTEPGSAPAYAISVKGRRLDAAPLIADQTPSDPTARPPRLDITASVDRVLTGKEAGIDGVNGSATVTGGRLERAHLKANAGKAVTFDYVPGPADTALHFAAGDAGAALAALNLTRGVRGGTLRFDGTTGPGTGPRLTTAALDMRDYRLVDAPIAARLVNAISPTGFVDLLSGQGLAFDRLDARLDYLGGKITFRDGRTAGALGISFEGDVDLDRNKVALKGTVVPVDTFNRILRIIPVIGEILTGGERGGLIGWTYTVSGAADDPRVSVNPLSMFAPGFLRNLFFLGPSQPKAEVAKDPPKPAGSS
jgi:hypothetical protein